MKKFLTVSIITFFLFNNLQNCYPIKLKTIKKKLFPCLYNSESKKSLPRNDSLEFEENTLQPKLEWSCYTYPEIHRRDIFLPGRINEDRFSMSQYDDGYIFGVYDGHCGNQASTFCSQHLPLIIMNNEILKTDKIQTIKNSFFIIDKDFCQSTLNNNEGCSALIALIEKNEIIIANAGDCKAIMCQSGIYVSLSQEHIPKLLDEKERITKNKGYISSGKVKGRLETTRGIGDKNFKKCGVIADPELVEWELNSNTEFLVLATDGLWNILSNQEVMDIVKTNKNHNNVSKLLVKQALDFHKKENIPSDDITVIVIFFQHEE